MTHILFLSIGPPLMVVWGLVYGLSKRLPEGLISSEKAIEFCAVLMLAIFCRSLWTITGRDFKSVTIAFGVLVLIWLGPSAYFSTGHTFWTAKEEEKDITETKDPYDAYKELDVEGMYYAQPQLLTQALQSLYPGQLGKKDVFFIGVGAWAFQDVFLKETMYAKDLFDHRFESQHRSVTLINHLSTYETIPLATSHNLNRTLQYMGTIMNPDEDLLILYMTSHGSKDHKLSVNFWPLELNDISPDMLRRYLDEAGIKWRVIVVSACYSGGFIEPLKTPYTAIASAAAPDRQSFGCGNKSEFTYFGEALLKDQLQEKFSFPLAFSGAIKAIEERELHENLEASLPQHFIGDEMIPYLNKLSHHLTRRVVGSDLSLNDHSTE